MLTFYFNSLVETNFLTTEQNIELLTFTKYNICATSPSKIKHMHHMTKINKVTSAANHDQPVHRMAKTSSSMSLLRAQLVANNNWFPYIDSDLAHRIDYQVADQSLQSITHEY